MEEILTLKLKLYLVIRPQRNIKALYILLSQNVTILFACVKLTETHFIISW
jgi:hypothetical protein